MIYIYIYEIYIYIYILYTYTYINILWYIILYLWIYLMFISRSSCWLLLSILSFLGSSSSGLHPLNVRCPNWWTGLGHAWTSKTSFDLNYLLSRSFKSRSQIIPMCFHSIFVAAAPSAALKSSLTFLSLSKIVSLRQTQLIVEVNSVKPSSSKSKHVKTLPACHHIPGASGTHLQWRSHSDDSESLSRKCRKDHKRPHVSDSVISDNFSDFESPNKHSRGNYLYSILLIPACARLHPSCRQWGDVGQHNRPALLHLCSVHRGLLVMRQIGLWHGQLSNNQVTETENLEWPPASRPWRWAADTAATLPDVLRWPEALMTKITKAAESAENPSVVTHPNTWRVSAFWRIWTWTQHLQHVHLHNPRGEIIKNIF